MDRASDRVKDARAIAKRPASADTSAKAIKLPAGAINCQTYNIVAEGVRRVWVVVNKKGDEVHRKSWIRKGGTDAALTLVKQWVDRN